MRGRCGILNLAMVTALGLLIGSCAQEERPVFSDRFGSAVPDRAWKVDVSRGNSIAVKNGALEISAAENTYAHVQRPLAVDRVRASCAIKPGSGISWCTSLFLYWGPGDWCQIGIIPRGAGRYYACITIDGRRYEHDLSPCRFSEWQRVAIELGDDCIRFLSGVARKGWRTELIVARPPGFHAPPAMFIAGKGFGLDTGQSDLNGDYGERGAMGVSLISEIAVTATPHNRLKITPAERLAQQRADQDPLGARILATKEDPSFEPIAALLPALAAPREIVGVKDHPYEIGIAHDGTIQLPREGDGWQQAGSAAFFEIGAMRLRFGAGGCLKRLLGGYLPMVVAEAREDGLQYEQTVFGYSRGMSADEPLWACVRMKVINASGQERATDLNLRVRERDIDAPLKRMTIPAGSWREVCCQIPCPPGDRSASEISPGEFEKRLNEAVAYWKSFLRCGMQISVPEARVNYAMRAALAYNAMNVDRRGGLDLPHDGAGFYEEVFGYSAVLYCHALDLWGRHEDSRRYLESLLTLQKPDGLFFVRFGLSDHGAMLMALAEHYRLSGDEAWLRTHAPKIIRMCDWLIGERKKATAATAASRPVTFGLIRFTPYADYQEQTYNYFDNAYCCVGLEKVAAVLNEIGLAADARRIASEAAAYRADILASMDAATVRVDGRGLLPMEADSHRLLQSTGYKSGGYYGLVASMLLESEFLPPLDPRARLIADALEKRGGMILGMCEFDKGVDHAYTHGYWLNCLRGGTEDQIRRVLLGFYSSLAYGMGRDTYCGVEVTQIMTGQPTPTMPHLYSGTQQLRLMRMMLLREEDGRLLIGQAIPRQWLRSGAQIDVTNAPTYFGPVSFTVHSALSRGRIRIFIQPPERRPPAAIELRLRHPGGKPIRSALVNDAPVDSFKADALTLRPGSGAMSIELRY